MEAMLREAQEDFRSFFESLGVGAYRNTGGPRGRFIKANPVIAEMFGFETVEEFMKVPVAELYADPEERRRFVEQVNETGQVRDRELLLKRKDGSTFRASCTATIRYDEAGKIKWMDGVIQDISEQKEAEERLRASEEEHRTLIENLSVGVYRNTAGSHGRFIKTNSAIARIFGYDSIEDFMEVSVSELYENPEDRQEFVAEVLEKETVRGRELRLKRKDGTPFWASCTATIQMAESGRIEWLDGIIEDITEKKEAEKALKRTNEVLNNILTASPVGIGLLEKGTIRWANEEMIRMFGFRSRKDYVGQDIRVVYPDEGEYTRVFQEIKERFKAGQSPEVDALYRRNDGSTFPGHFKVSCPDPEEPSKRAIFTIHDISWRQQAEAERLGREKMEGVLETAGAVCHEMNQPIQGISSISEVLAMGLEEEDPVYSKVRKIAQLAERMGSITNKLMRITKYETKDYVQGIRIIDIDKASRRNGET